MKVLGHEFTAGEEFQSKIYNRKENKDDRIVESDQG